MRIGGRIAGLIALAAVLTVACGGSEKGNSYAWDLTAPPRQATLGWPKSANPAFFTSPRHSTVDLRLPGGHRLQMRDVEVSATMPYGYGTRGRAVSDRVETIDVRTGVISVDAAAGVLRRLIADWGVTGLDVESWLLSENRPRTALYVPSRTYWQRPKPLAPSGPSVGIGAFPQAGDKPIAFVKIAFTWPVGRP